MPHVFRHPLLPLSPPPTLPITPQALPEPFTVTPSPHDDPSFATYNVANREDGGEGALARVAGASAQGRGSSASSGPGPGGGAAKEDMMEKNDNVELLTPLSPSWALDLEHEDESGMHLSGVLDHDQSALMRKPEDLGRLMGMGAVGYVRDDDAPRSSRHHYHPSSGFASMVKEDRSLWMPHEDDEHGPHDARPEDYTQTPFSSYTETNDESWHASNFSGPFLQGVDIPGASSSPAGDGDVWMGPRSQDSDSISSSSYPSELDLATPTSPNFPCHSGFKDEGYSHHHPVLRGDINHHDADDILDEEHFRFTASPRIGLPDLFDISSTPSPSIHDHDHHHGHGPNLMFSHDHNHCDSDSEDGHSPLLAPQSPSRRSVSLLPDLDLDDMDRETPQPPSPSSPSRRAFTSLPDIDLDMNMGVDAEPRHTNADMDTDVESDSSSLSSSSSTSSPLPSTSPMKLLSLPGADTDDDLIVPDQPPIPTPILLSSSSHTPSLGLFLPLLSASSASSYPTYFPSASSSDVSSDPHAHPHPRSPSPSLNDSSSSEPPDLDSLLSEFNALPPDARAKVDKTELEGLMRLRRKYWVKERNAKRTEGMWAEEARRVAEGICVSPRVPGAVVCEIDEDECIEEDGEGQGEGEVAKREREKVPDPVWAVRRELSLAEARRAEARKIRKREKERGKELHALLRLKLGEHASSSQTHPQVMHVDGSMSVDGDGEANNEGDVAKGALGLDVNAKGKKSIGSSSQLVARMLFKRRETSRPLSGRKVAGERGLGGRRSSSRLSVSTEGGSDYGSEDEDDDKSRSEGEEGMLMDGRNAPAPVPVPVPMLQDEFVVGVHAHDPADIDVDVDVEEDEDTDEEESEEEDEEEELSEETMMDLE